MGNLPVPLVKRSTNSLDSSITVKSAPSVVSYTSSNPRRRSAATILPSTFVPIGMPNSSPSAARTAGAVCTITILSGSLIASITSCVLSFSVSAPVGQALMHWPQETQATWLSGCSNAQPISVSKPRLFAPITATCCCWQAATQRRHRMHFALSRSRCSVE